MKNVKNQHQQVLWYLINWDEFSFLDIVKDSMCLKFQTRLSEIENEYGSLTEKRKEVFINRFDRISRYTVYKCTDKNRAKELMNKY